MISRSFRPLLLSSSSPHLLSRSAPCALPCARGQSPCGVRSAWGARWGGERPEICEGVKSALSGAGSRDCLMSCTLVRAHETDRFSRRRRAPVRCHVRNACGACHSRTHRPVQDAVRSPALRTHRRCLPQARSSKRNGRALRHAECNAHVAAVRPAPVHVGALGAVQRGIPAVSPRKALPGAPVRARGLSAFRFGVAALLRCGHVSALAAPHERPRAARCRDPGAGCRCCAVSQVYKEARRQGRRPGWRRKGSPRREPRGTGQRKPS